MNRRDLTGRLERVARRLVPAEDWQVWLPEEDPARDDGRVTNLTTRERAAPVEVRRRLGQHVVVEYVDGGEGRAP